MRSTGRRASLGGSARWLNEANLTDAADGFGSVGLSGKPAGWPVSTRKSAGRNAADSPAIIMESQWGGVGACLPGVPWQGGALGGSEHLTMHCAPGTNPAVTAIARKNAAALIDLRQLYRTPFFCYCDTPTWSLHCESVMSDRYPLTIAQLRQTKEDVGAMKEQAEEISRLIAAGYGDADPKAIRAGELNSAIQRLIWELERSGAGSADAINA